MSIKTRELDDSEKIDLIVQLCQARIVTLKVNCLNEIEIIPIGFDWENWWFLLDQWKINEKDMKLFPKLLVNLHKNGIVLPKHTENHVRQTKY